MSLPEPHPKSRINAPLSSFSINFSEFPQNPPVMYLRQIYPHLSCNNQVYYAHYFFLLHNQNGNFREFHLKLSYQLSALPEFQV